MIKDFWKKSFPVLRNKYVLTGLVFLVWLMLFDQNNWLDKMAGRAKFNQLKDEKEYFLEKIEQDQQRLKELKTDKENLEKFAREQYLMKCDDEDVFIVVDDEN